MQRFLAGRGWLFLAVLPALLTAGCSSIPRRLAPIQPELLSVSLVEASFEGQRFQVELMLSNPNAVEIPVRQIEFDVRLAGEGLLQGVSYVPVTLPAQGRETVTVEIFSEIVSSVSRLMSLAEGPDNSLDYELQGLLTLDVAMREPVAMAYRGRVPLTVPGDNQ